jgi:GNAT superfamily N-acetyltransferase
MTIHIKEDKDFSAEAVLELYKANKWSSAEKPDLLIPALQHSATLITAYDEERLIGLGNAITDGHLVVYYPHLLVHPDYHGKGIGRMIVDRFQEIYGHFHQQMLTADGGSVEFYKKCGFQRAGQTVPMWVYQGNEH